MDWTGEQSKAAGSNWCLDCLWGHQAAAFRRSHSWQQPVSGFLAGGQAHECRFISCASATCIFLCHFFLCSIWIPLLAVTHMRSPARAHSLFFVSSRWEHEMRQHLWSEFCHGINGTDVWSVQEPGSVSLCVSVCDAHLWHEKIFTSHLSIFIISLDREWAWSSNFVQWAVILGPWQQNHFL